MPYLNNRSLPADVKGQLPPAGQQIWRTTFNAQQLAGVDDEAAHAAAWRELTQRGWHKDESGTWNPPTQKRADGAVFASVLKQDAPQRFTLGIVYAPDDVDTQGDFCKAATIEKAAWAFMRQLQGGKTLTKWAAQLLDAIVKAVQASEPIRLDVSDMVEDIAKARAMLGDQHSSWDESYGAIVESYICPFDGTLDNGEMVTKGTWLMGIVWSPEYFEKIQSGARTGLSMGGTGKRQWVETLAA